MSVILIYPNITDYPIDISFGLAAVSSYLKEAGHKVLLYDCTFDYSKKELESIIKRNNPTIIGIPVASNDFHFAVKICSFIKSITNIPVIAGGFHTTMVPEDIMSKDCFDIAVIGEGEDTLLEIVESIESGSSSTRLKDIEGIWYRSEGSLYKNNLRPPKQDINSLPFPDRELFDYKRYVSINRGLATFISSYGCPFECTYCINKTLMKKYGIRGSVRYKSVEYIIQEILSLVTQFKIREIEFYDDTFTINKQRLKEFCNIYPEKIGLPFYINSRVELLTKDVIHQLKEAGCERISMGIETGDEFVRNQICKRNQSDSQIIEAFSMARESGIKTLSYNMVGIPYETKESIEKTVLLNQQCQPDFVAVSIFNAYKGTEIYDLCKNNGWLRHDNGMAYFQTSNIDHPSFTLGELKSIRDRFGYLVFRDRNLKRAVIDYSDKKMLNLRIYQQCRSFLIKHGVKKLL
jgi:anaerobic magnesium-protoporphyrin IX monomethyl ester cyclase